MYKYSIQGKHPLDFYVWWEDKLGDTAVLFQMYSVDFGVHVINVQTIVIILVNTYPVFTLYQNKYRVSVKTLSRISLFNHHDSNRVKVVGSSI